MLGTYFFRQTAIDLAPALLGKVISFLSPNTKLFLMMKIIETEAYEVNDKASHAWLGRTPSREALFMPAGTIYMHHCRGAATLNISSLGDGAAVLIKSALVYPYPVVDNKMIAEMQKNNPLPGPRNRPIHRLGAGQTLLCRALGLSVADWNMKNFNDNFFIQDVGYKPSKIITRKRLGIPAHRDPDKLYRFIDNDYLFACTKPNN